MAASMHKFTQQNEKSAKEGNVESLRMEIWDYLYASGPTSIDRIGEATDHPQDMVLEAVNHDWFQKQDDVVAIAIHDTP